MIHLSNRNKEEFIMTKENRIKEIISQMHSFKKEAYHKAELLPEYLELQREMINLTFNDSHAENGKLRIWDVENHFEKLNEECNHIADSEFAEFKDSSRFFSNLIKSEFSGNAGEYKAFRSLEMLRCKNKIMKNIEFKSGDHRTEIDAIVFTEKAIFIIEVKNLHRDIFIDERGNYCRVGNTMNLDCNIGEKMNEKVYLLREALKKSKYANANIVSLVVFTNSTMHVENRYNYITTCFLGNLSHIIERYDGKPIYSDSCISTMMDIVSAAECKEAYPPEIDINQYKYRFANLMATLEEAIKVGNTNCEADANSVVNESTIKTLTPKKSSTNTNSKTRLGNIVKGIGAVAVLGVGIVVSHVINSYRK